MEVHLVRALALQSTISLWLGLVGLANSTVLILYPSISPPKLPPCWSRER